MASYQILTDIELTACIRSGDELAFTEVYSRYWKKLLAIAYHYTKDKIVAEEIVQEVFISLWNRRNKVKIKSLANYLATAIKFSVFKQLARQKRRLDIVRSISEPAPLSLDEQEIDARFLKEYITGIVEQLPDKCRLVFKYSRDNGLTIPEIARQMELSEKTVESHLTKALKTIRLDLDRSGLLTIIAGGICMASLSAGLIGL